ncbi:hypothetical protein GCM10009844_41780 [Nocardioides koreensis]|uniref:Uncharacterized protein n=1 Tax=Nocardioides koreensis TaxID=433651 RepID=A0ABP5LZI4_9ACTN
MTRAGEADLTELRTVVARAREQALRLTREAQAGRAALQEQRAQLRAERQRLERDALAAYRNGTLGHQERALVQRIDRGETTWRAVAAGTDDHWTAAALREAVGEQVEEQVEQMREADPDFLREHEAAIRSAEEMARRAQW